MTCCCDLLCCFCDLQEAEAAAKVEESRAQLSSIVNPFLLIANSHLLPAHHHHHAHHFQPHLPLSSPSSLTTLPEPNSSSLRPDIDQQPKQQEEEVEVDQSNTITRENETEQTEETKETRETRVEVAIESVVGESESQEETMVGIASDSTQ